VARITTFRFTTEPDAEGAAAFRRHMGARRFAYNECRRAVVAALAAKRVDPGTVVPWSGFSLINWFNAWKKTETAGRRFAVDSQGCAELVDVGLLWRGEVCAQVFEEAAVDLGRALAAFSASKKGQRKGARVGFPRAKKKGRAPGTFRLRNKVSPSGTPSIRLGEAGARSLTLPFVGIVALREDTRALRRLLRLDAAGSPRARICAATVTEHRGRFVITITVEAPDFHPQRRHGPGRSPEGFVGIDRGLRAYVVAATADGKEVVNVSAPRPLERSLGSLRRASRTLSRRQPGSQNRRKARVRLQLIHAQVADQRRDFCHRLSSELVKTHDALCLEDLAVANLVRNKRLARPIADASWGHFAQMVSYKAEWFGSDLCVAPRFFPSTKTCSACGWLWSDMALKDRTFICATCALVADRDLNAAINLAAWANAEHDSASQAPDPQAGGRVINACGGSSAGHQIPGGETALARVRVSAGKEAGTGSVLASPD
jgi:putative transposase